MNSEPKASLPAPAWLALVLLAGVAARFWVGTLGHNYDFESYRVVADITAQGKNVYASTDRYNYGPVMFNLVHGLDVLAGHDPARFREWLTGVLTAADIGISYILWRRFGRMAATLFFLNPVSILITGYHNQFDNVAVLLGLWAMVLLGDDLKKPVDRRKLSGLLILGLSLMTKHIFFAFPLWLAVKQRGLLQKCIILAVPTAVFLAGFLPYWSAGHAGIIKNVFFYRSAVTSSAFFYSQLVPALFTTHVSPTTCWLAVLVLFAFVCRTRNSIESLLIYACVLVAASPALTNQYLAIPAAAAVALLNPFFAAYILFAALHICVDSQGIHLLNDSGGCAGTAIACLCAALVWHFWRAPIGGFLQHCGREIAGQFRPEKLPPIA